MNFFPYKNIHSFCKDTHILCVDGTTIPIQFITTGTLIQTLTQGPKRVITVGERTIPDFNRTDKLVDRIYKYGSSDLLITGDHCILVDILTELQVKQVTYYYYELQVTIYKFTMFLIQANDCHYLYLHIVEQFSTFEEGPEAEAGKCGKTSEYSVHRS